MGMGGNAFWNFQRQGGVKTWKPSVVGYGYFLELPNTRKNASFATLFLYNLALITHDATRGVTPSIQ